MTVVLELPCGGRREQSLDLPCLLLYLCQASSSGTPRLNSTSITISRPGRTTSAGIRALADFESLPFPQSRHEHAQQRGTASDQRHRMLNDLFAKNGKPEIAPLEKKD